MCLSVVLVPMHVCVHANTAGGFVISANTLDAFVVGAVHVTAVVLR